MIGNVSGRERILIGIGVLAALVVVGWTFLVQPIRERYQSAAELTPVREQVLTRRVELLLRKGVIARELDTTNAQLQAAGNRLLSTATPAVAASELQKLTKEMAVQASTEIRSERRDPSTRRPPVTDGADAQDADGPGSQDPRRERHAAQGAAGHDDHLGFHPPGQAENLMTKRLRLVTVLFAGIAIVLVAIIAKELTARPPRPPAPRAQSTATTVAPSAPAAPAAPPAAGAGNYGMIASRNLFSPTRSEAPPAPPPAPVVNLPKPNLYGVIFQEAGPVAYLEDPVTKRVARYRIGDTVAGGTLKSIDSDSVVLSRPDGQIAVRLHDPTRPRPAGPPAAAPMPGAPMPGVVAPTPTTPTVFPPQGVAPAAATPPSPGAISRRPLPPSVLGRIPPADRCADTTLM